MSPCFNPPAVNVVVSAAAFTKTDSEGPNEKPDNQPDKTKAARFRGGFLSEVIGWAPRGLRTQWCL